MADSKSVHWGSANLKFFEVTHDSDSHVIPSSGSLALIQGDFLYETEEDLSDPCSDFEEDGPEPLDNFDRSEWIQEFDNYDVTVARNNKKEIDEIRRSRQKSPFCDCKPLEKMSMKELRAFIASEGIKHYSAGKKGKGKHQKRKALIQVLKKQGYDVYACCTRDCPCIKNGICCMQDEDECSCAPHRKSCQNSSQYLFKWTPNVKAANDRWESTMSTSV